MSIIKKKVVIPVNITVKDEDDNIIGNGSGSIEFEYQYEVPDIKDYLLKGSLPAVGLNIVIDRIIKRGGV